MERHVNTMPPDVDPKGVRTNVERAKKMVRQGHWTPTDLQTAGARLPGVRKAERALHDIRLAKVREVYVQAKQAIAQGHVPVTYFKDGVPGGVSSRPDMRLGFEVKSSSPATISVTGPAVWGRRSNERGWWTGRLKARS